MILSKTAAAHKSKDKERVISRLTVACNALYAAKKAKGPDVVWVPELGPCNSWERQLVKELVAERITYEASMGAWFNGGTP